MGLDAAAAQRLQAHQGRQAAPGEGAPGMLKLGLPVVEGRRRIPHQHLVFFPLAEERPGPGVAVVEPIVPGGGLGQDQVNHIIWVPGGESLALRRPDHIIGRRDHLGEIGHLGKIIVKPPERGDDRHVSGPPPYDNNPLNLPPIG